MGQEHHARIKALRAAFPPDLDALLVSAPSNIFYLSGFTGSAGLIVVSAEQALLYSDFRYRAQAREQAPDFAFVEVERGLVKGMGEKLNAMGLARIGFDSAHLTYQHWETLQEQTPAVTWAPAPGVVETLRLAKSAAEIELMRQAARLADDTLAQMVAMMKPGVTERDIALEGEFFMRRQGAEAVAFKLIVASGPHGALPHAEVTDRALQPGDLVVIDMGAQYHGYCSDITRTFAIAQASEETRAIYSLVYRAQRSALAQVRAGMVCGELDAVARTIITEAGYGEAFGHGLGHGVGVEVHEAPRVAREVETTLAIGHVVTIEPGIYLEGMGGVRLEDMVAVHADGCEVLTRYPIEAEVPIIAPA